MITDGDSGRIEDIYVHMCMRTCFGWGTFGSTLQRYGFFSSASLLFRANWQPFCFYTDHRHNRPKMTAWFELRLNYTMMSEMASLIGSGAYLHVTINVFLLLLC